MRGRSKMWHRTASATLGTRRVSRDVGRYDDDRADTRRGDSGRYVSGYRVSRDGSYREDFGSDR